MIRSAHASDAKAIAAIWNQVIRETTITFNPIEKTDAEVADLLAHDATALVFEQDDTVQGFARYFPFRQGEGYKFSVEHTIMLTQAARGKGAGRSLMTALLSHAKSAEKHMMYAAISGENPGAVAFHEACGFTTLAVLPEVGFKFDRWIDLVLMQKRL